MFALLASDSEAEALETPIVSPEPLPEGYVKAKRRKAKAKAKGPKPGTEAFQTQLLRDTEAMISRALKPLRPALAERVRHFLGSQEGH